MSDYIKAAEPSWRAAHVKSVKMGDCCGLVPLCAALKNVEELGSVSLALKALPRLCPGVSGDLPLTAAQAVQQFYSELVFLRALDAASGN